MPRNPIDLTSRSIPWEENIPFVSTPRPVLDLLLSSHLSKEDVREILGPFHFKDILKADENLQLIAEDPRARQILAEILEMLLSCLARSPDPDQALNFLERFCRAALSRIHLLSYLKDSPWTLWLLARVFGSSPYLAETLIRNPAVLYWVARPEILREGFEKKSGKKELSGSLRGIRSVEARRNILRVFKRREMLRIGVRDLLRVATVSEITGELSDLADVLIQQALQLAEKELHAEVGGPPHRTGSGKKESSVFCVLGMGKLGGRELNFSSDVDLIYICHPEGGRTSGRESRGKIRGGSRVSGEEYFKQLAQKLTKHLSAVTNEGSLFRVDLRLRPEGSTGPLVHSLRSARRYYSSRGSTWERLALLKTRPVAGDMRLGKQFVEGVSSFVYRPFFSPEKVDEVRAVKEKINRKVRLKNEALRNVKLGTGGIREVEFIVQSIQVFFGGKIPGIRTRNTLDALVRLSRAGILDREQADGLSEAYLFLRDVEHKLQMVHEEQTHTLPKDLEELGRCALRLGFEGRGGRPAVDFFLEAYRDHTSMVSRVFSETLGDPEGSEIFRRAGAKSRGRSKPKTKKPL